jgi:rfaE bifunctional protein nucleotidyltransferase chain/domain
MAIIVFTNGCFDVLHRGHVELLTRARALGDRLVVGLNTDASVRAIKGPGRPFVAQEDRAAVLRGLRSVDGLVFFDDPTPQQLIEELRPDVLVKGGDWPMDQIVGADFVRSYGGRVVSVPLREGYATTALAARIAAAVSANASTVATTRANASMAAAESANASTAAPDAKTAAPADRPR